MKQQKNYKYPPSVHGLTGSIACGKTTVANFFKKYGAFVIDLDDIAKEVVKPGKVGLKSIINEFGKEYLNEFGELDRKKLADLIFKNHEAKEKLEKILHPLIFQQEKKIIYNFLNENPNSLIISDAALMIETGSYKRYNKLIVVYVPEKIQIERLIKRDGISYEEAVHRIKSQMPIEEKIKYADFIIDNSKSLDYTEQQVKKILMELKNGN